MPDEPPVMTATLPASFSMIFAPFVFSTGCPRPSEPRARYHLDHRSRSWLNTFGPLLQLCGSVIHLSRQPVRADARKNYSHLLDVARDVAAEHGADVSMRDIARRADVGLATL